MKCALINPVKHTLFKWSAILIFGAVVWWLLYRNLAGLAKWITDPANPLTARFGIVHGFAVGLMLPSVIRFNAADAAAHAAYRALGSPVEILVERVELLLRLTGAPKSLRGFGVTAADVAELAVMAKKQWTAGFNPRPISEADFAALYTAVLD